MQPPNTSLIRLDEIKPTPIRWVLPGFIAYGKIAIVEGLPDRGKTTLAFDIAARITTGTPMPDGTSVEPGSVIILSAEDGPGDTILPRIKAAGGDPSRVFIGGDDLGGQRAFKFPTDVPRLAALVKQHDAKLLIVDPFSSYIQEGFETRKEQDMRQVLFPISLMAQRFGIAVVLLRHFTKNENASPILRGGGSIGIAAAARSVIAVTDHPEYNDRRLLTSVKLNIGLRPRPWEFSFESVGDVARIVWLGQVDIDPNALIGESVDERSARRNLADVMIEALSDGPLRPLTMQNIIREAGILVSDRTLRRVVAEHLRSARLGFGPNAIYLWYLPEHEEYVAMLKEIAKKYDLPTVAKKLSSGGK